MAIKTKIDEKILKTKKITETTEPMLKTAKIAREKPAIQKPSENIVAAAMEQKEEKAQIVNMPIIDTPIIIHHVDALGRGYGTGRAKNDAIARVWVSFAKAKAAKKNNIEAIAPVANVMINDFEMKDYFKRDSLLAIILKPIKSLRDLPANTAFDINCTVAGGGLAGQAKALALGISRGLIVLNPEFKSTLRAAGLLTRGPIGKEREKPGQRGARADLPYKRR